MSRFGLPTFIDSDNLVPKRIIGYISVQGKASVFGQSKPTLHKSAKAYHADKKDRDSVRKSLEKSGFEILAESALGISVAAEPGQYEELTGGNLYVYRSADLQSLYEDMEQFWWAIFYFNGYRREPKNAGRAAEFRRLCAFPQIQQENRERPKKVRVKPPGR
jgi:hypothetical protein